MRHLGPGAGDEQVHQLTVHLVVLGHQDTAAQVGRMQHGQLATALGHFRGVPDHVDIVQWPAVDRDLELTALAIDTVHPDITAQQLGEMPGDAQAQPRSPVLASGGGGTLGEGVEQALHLLRLHTDAGIHHPGMQLFLLPVTADRDVDTALIGELERITAQVDQDLAETCRIRADDLRQRVLTLDEKLEPLLPGPGGEEGTHLVQQFREVDVQALHLKLVRIDHGMVENVVDQVEKVTP